MDIETNYSYSYILLLFRLIWNTYIYPVYCINIYRIKVINVIINDYLKTCYKVTFENKWINIIMQLIL